MSQRSNESLFTTLGRPEELLAALPGVSADNTASHSEVVANTEEYAEGVACVLEYLSENNLLNTENSGAVNASA